jgi:prepilin peptidase dependent protein B
MLTRPMSASRSRRWWSRHGLSLVELMVGIAVGLLVVAGALSISARNLANSHRLLADARFNQDLRAAMDLITRDLRRAGYWGNAIQGTQAVGATSSTTPNPYSAFTGENASGFTYGFSRDSTENNSLDSNEQFGFRIHSGALQMQRDSEGWQDVTDVKVLRVADDGLVITPAVSVLPLGHLCPKICNAGTPDCPTATVRSYGVTLTASSAADTTLTRTLRTAVRLRNDQLSGRCPA